MKLSLNVLCGILVFSTSAVLSDTTLIVTNNLILRLDASDVELNGSNVSNWNNQAVGPVVSADFIQTDNAAQPTLVSNALNGHPVLEFDGTSDYFFNLTDSAWEWNWDATSNAVDAARWTVFCVCKPDVNTGNRFLLRSAYSDVAEGASTYENLATWGVWMDDDDYSVHGRQVNGISWVDARWLNTVDFNWHIVGGVIQNTNNPSITLLRDGDVKGTTDVDTTRQMNGHIRSRIGASTTYPTANEFFDGQIAEVLVYKEVLSNEDMEEVNRYLTLKYNFCDQFETNLVLHCRMDNKQVNRDGVKPPPALTTDDGEWTVMDLIEPAENGTAKAVNNGGQVLSSATGVIGEAIRFSDSTLGDRRVDFGDADTLEPGDGSFTVSLWFKPTGLGGYTVCRLAWQCRFR